MAFDTQRATFTATAGPITVTWSSAFSGTTYFIVAGAPQTATGGITVRIDNVSTTQADVTASASFTGTVDLFAFE